MYYSGRMLHSYRIKTFSMYEDTQDLLIHIPKWAAVLVLVLMYNPTHYYVLWALHRNNNTHCNGDIPQYDGQTWSPFPRSQIY